jgi:catechol 2,3-dioxygenase-like lactoylglutathione lyase family enzyme
MPDPTPPRGNTGAPSGIHAVVLIVPDLDAARAFYEDTLGLEVDADYGDAVFFNVGAQKLALFGPDHHPEGNARLGGADHGVSHLEFVIPATARKAFEARLRASGAPQVGGCWQDPAGFLFHTVQGATE